MAHSFRGKLSETGNFDRDFPLKIAHLDVRSLYWQLAIHYAGGLCSDWKLRVMSRAPLSKVRYAHAH